LHSCPIAHAAHAAAPVPHEPFDSDAYGSHAPVGPPLQQPLGHVSVSQVQRPLVVSQSPLAHAAQAAPPAPHCEPDWEAYARQLPPAQQPLGHETASHAQPIAPLVHSSPDAHAAHAAPPAPHCDPDWEA
jgi:hypothetical protein